MPYASNNNAVLIDGCNNLQNLSVLSSVQNGGPGAACGEQSFFTAETSNMSYSDINGAPASTVTQILQQPVSCAVNSLFEAQLGEMRQIRDLNVAQYPAGQWSWRFSIAIPLILPCLSCRTKMTWRGLRGILSLRLRT
jgi:hypothetical protein